MWKKRVYIANFGMVTYPPPTIIIVEVGASRSRQVPLPDLASYPRGPRGSLSDASCTQLTHTFSFYVLCSILIPVMICQTAVTEPFFYTKIFYFRMYAPAFAADL